MKRLTIVLLTIIFIVFSQLKTFANNDETINEQKKEFGIQDFLKNSKEYIGESFDDINIEDMLNNAINGNIDNKVLAQKIFSLFGDEITFGLAPYYQYFH